MTDRSGPATRRSLSRRRLLRAGALAGGAALAGCSGGTGGGNTDTASTPTPTAPATRTRTPTAADGGTTGETAPETATGPPVSPDAQLWTHPNIRNRGDVPTEAAERAVGRNPGAWDTVREREDVFSFFVNAAWKESDDVTPIVETVTGAGDGIAVEAGAVYGPEDRQGAAMADFEYEKAASIRAAGGTVTHLTIDGVVRRGIQNYGWSVEHTLDAFVAYLDRMDDLMDHAFDLGWIVNFPNWAYKDWPSQTGVLTRDWYEVFTTTLDRLDGAGFDLDYLHVDNPYGYAKRDPRGEFSRVLDLESEVADRDPRFGLIFNSERPKHYDDPSARFYADTLAYLREYHAAGGRPDTYVIESWYDYPAEIVPEETDHTFTNVARDGFGLVDSWLA